MRVRYGTPMHESATPSSDADGSAVRLEPLAYTVPEAAAALRQGERKVWALVKAKKIRSYTVGTSRRISRQALLDFQRELEMAEQENVA